MTKQRGDSILGLFVVWGLVLAALVLVLMMLNSYGCGQRWKRSGLQHDYGVFQGCQVRLPDGRWLPEDRVREIDLSIRKKENG